MKSMFRVIILFSFTAGFLVSCSAPEGDVSAPVEEIIREDWSRYFAGRDGCFVLYDPETDEVQVYNPERAKMPYSPASTFKMLNAMVGLEEGAVLSVNEIIPWDDVDRNIKVWNQDQTIETALNYSCVWFFQAIAQRVGAERMDYWIDTCNYGNAQMGSSISTFWLDGELRITAMEQIDFLEKWRTRSLAFSKMTQDAIYDVLPSDELPNYTLKSKTGWSIGDEAQIGWLAGFIESGGKQLLFALNIDLGEEEDGNLRKSIAVELLNSEIPTLLPN